LAGADEALPLATSKAVMASGRIGDNFLIDVFGCCLVDRARTWYTLIEWR
jgi:hypothetical protein